MSQRLDQLPEAGALDGSELLYVVQNSSDAHIKSDTYRQVAHEGSNLLAFGADASGATKSQTAVNNLISDAADTRKIVLPRGTYLIDDFTADLSELVIVSHGATLLFASDTTADAVLALLGADNAVYGTLIVDTNQANLATDYPGSGEGVRWEGARGYAHQIISRNQPVQSNANSFEIRGRDFTGVKCRSVKAGYAGFRSNGVASLVNGEPVGGIHLIDCVAEDFDSKGYANNGDCEQVILDNFDGNPATAGAAGTNHVLGETGTDKKLHTLALKNSRIRGGSVGIVKVDSVRRLLIDNSDLEQTATGEVALFIAQGYGGTGNYAELDVVIDGSSIRALDGFAISDQAGFVSSSQAGTTLHATDATIATDGAHAVQQSGPAHTYTDCQLKDATTSMIRWADSTERSTVVRGGHMDGADDTVRLFSNVAGDIAVGDLKVLDGFRVLAGDTSPGGLTGVNDWDDSVQRGGSMDGENGFREFHALDAPTAGGPWERGDRVYIIRPSASGLIGWVCTEGGDFRDGDTATDPTFDSFGSIADENAGTATFSGDGSTTTFSVPHGLPSAPNARQVTAESPDADGAKHISNVDGTNIDVTFASAPASGTDNVVLGFNARL